MKRDILIFPKFKNIDKLQEIRKQYDPLALILPPHITLVFPFSDNISNDELVSLVKDKIKNIVPFCVKFSNVLIDYDTYTKSNFIYLNCIDGNDTISFLHDTLYSIPTLSNHLNSKIAYKPHITLGYTDSINFELNDVFETIVDEIVIEEIGENDESIIIEKIPLK